MSELNKFNYKIIKFLIIVVFTIIIYLFLQLYQNMNNELYLSIKSDLEVRLAHQEQLISLEFERSKDIFTSIADSITETELEVDEVYDYLAVQLENTYFTEMYFLDTNGNAISSKAKPCDFSENASFKNSLIYAGVSSGISGKSTFNNTIIDIATPLYENGEIIGILFAEYPLDIITDRISETMYDSGYAMITNIDGVEVFSTTDEYIPLERLREPDVQFLNNDSYDNIRANLANKQGGVTYFEIDGVTRIAVYTPLAYNDWTLVMVVDESQVEQGTRNLANTLTVVSIAICAVLLAFMAYIVYSHINNIKKIEHVAYYDELTKLPNLTKLKKHMTETLKEHPENSYTIIKCDVDNFKAINELFSFDIGNLVLKTFKSVSESVDEETLIVARTGIDEFMFFSGNGFLDNLEENTHIYESYFKQTIPELAHHQLSFKYGRYFIEKGEQDVDDIVNKVSMAHSMSKEKKGQIVYDYDDKFKKQLREQADIANKMEEALNNKEFIAYLQPKMGIADGNLIGAEALVRWIDSSGTMIFPDVFIPLFERNGFIVSLDKCVLKAVCSAIKQWLQRGIECVPVSINFSRVHLENDNFVSEISEIVDRYEVPHSLIEIELTESTILENDNLLDKLLNDLHSKGFIVSMDDFGAGYSSLGLLKNFEIDILKLDRSFFANTKYDKRGELVVDGIVKLAHSLEMRVVAEGIEEQAQVDFLKSIGCEYAQGYLYSRPISIAEFENKYFTDN